MVIILSNREQRCVASDDSADQSNTATFRGASGPEDVSKRLVGIFKLLADETRLRILLALFERNELNVRALCDLLEQSQPAVSHHLALLKADGLIECRREGKHNYYRILPQRFEQLVGTVFSALPDSGAYSGVAAKRRIRDGQGIQDISTVRAEKTDD